MNDQVKPIGARALIRELGDCFVARGWRDEENFAYAMAGMTRYR